MIVEGQSTFLLELDTEQIPNIFEVKLNTDGTIQMCCKVNITLGR